MIYIMIYIYLIIELNIYNIYVIIELQKTNLDKERDTNSSPLAFNDSNAALSSLKKGSGFSGLTDGSITPA